MNFNTFLLFILIYYIYTLKDDVLNKEDKKSAPNSSSKLTSILLPDYLSKHCKIFLAKPLYTVEPSVPSLVEFSIKGTILEFDDDWVLIEYDCKKKKETLIIKRSLILNIIQVID